MTNAQFAKQCKEDTITFATKLCSKTAAYFNKEIQKSENEDWIAKHPAYASPVCTMKTSGQKERWFRHFSNADCVHLLDDIKGSGLCHAFALGLLDALCRLEPDAEKWYDIATEFAETVPDIPEKIRNKYISDDFSICDSVYYAESIDKAAALAAMLLEYTQYSAGMTAEWKNIAEQCLHIAEDVFTRAGLDMDNTKFFVRRLISAIIDADALYERKLVHSANDVLDEQARIGNKWMEKEVSMPKLLNMYSLMRATEIYLKSPHVAALLIFENSMLAEDYSDLFINTFALCMLYFRKDDILDHPGLQAVLLDYLHCHFPWATDTEEYPVIKDEFRRLIKTKLPDQCPYDIEKTDTLKRKIRTAQKLLENGIIMARSQADNETDAYAGESELTQTIFGIMSKFVFADDEDDEDEEDEDDEEYTENTDDVCAADTVRNKQCQNKNKDNTEDKAEEIPAAPDKPHADVIAEYKVRINELIQQNARIRKESAEASKSARHAEADYMRSVKQLEAEKQALALENAALKATVEQLLNVNEEQEKADPVNSIELPVTLKHKIVSVGGHRSWLPFMRQYVPNLVIVEPKPGNSPELQAIKNADAVFIKSNCISHSQFWAAVEMAKQNNKPLYYYTATGPKPNAVQLFEVDKSLP